jgi:hypothetical protein
MPVERDVIVEALGAMTTPIEMGILLQASYEDGIPLTNHQAREIARISEKCIQIDGFYTMNNMTDGKGTVFTFFNREGLILSTIILNFPNVAVERKIPSLRDVKTWFNYIGYHNERIEIKMLQTLIESHIRDGGSFNHFITSNALTFTLRMNGHVKSRYEFMREDLSA